MTGLPFRSQGEPLVKICGARREIDLLAVRDAGADLVGLVFAPSKRRVEPALAREMVPVLQGQLPVVGVFVNAPLDEVNAIVDLVPLQFVQLSGQEDPEYVQAVRAPVIKVVHLREGETADGVLARMGQYTDVCAFLVEAWSPLGGGSGRQANWQLATAIIGQAPRPVLLAGGLTPSSVASALAQTNAYGVDVSSGVERDGWKDPDLIQEFVRAARSTTRRVPTEGHPSP
jgi:phosphoribosylanthranilate isomerase